MMSKRRICVSKTQKKPKYLQKPDPKPIRQHEQSPAQLVTPKPAYRRPQVNYSGLRSTDILALQRTVGNRQVQRIVAQRTDGPGSQQQEKLQEENSGRSSSLAVVPQPLGQDEQPGQHQQVPTHPLRQKRGGGQYTIRQGDSYAKISKQIYGSEAYTSYLQQANPVKKDLQPGIQLSTPEILIPAQLTDDEIKQLGVNTMLTEEAEGSLDPASPYYVLKLHVPDEKSGITLSYGYDLKERKQLVVERDLLRIGVNANQAKLISEGIGKKGKEARQYIKEKGLRNFELTEKQAKNLFTSEFANQFNETIRRIAQDFESGLTFDTLHNKILEILTDLKYRGDLTRRIWEILRDAVKNNDVEKLKMQMSLKRNWIGVPYDRYKRRCEYLGGKPEPEVKASVKEKFSEKTSVQRATETVVNKEVGQTKAQNVNQTNNSVDIVSVLQEIEQEIAFNKTLSVSPNLSQSERYNLDQNLLELETRKVEQWRMFTAKQPITNSEYASWILKAGELGFVDHLFGSKEQLEQLRQNKVVSGIDPVASEKITALLTMHAIVQAAVKRWIDTGMPLHKPAVTLGSFIRPQEKSPHGKGQAIDINKLYLTGENNVSLGTDADVIQMLSDLPPGEYELGLPPQGSFFKPDDLLQIPDESVDKQYKEKNRGPKEGRKEKTLAQYKTDNGEQVGVALPDSVSSSESPPPTTISGASTSLVAAPATKVLAVPPSITEQSYKFWSPFTWTSSWNAELQKWDDKSSNDVYILLQSEDLKKQIRKVRQKDGYDLVVIPDYLRHFHLARR